MTGFGSLLSDCVFQRELWSTVGTPELRSAHFEAGDEDQRDGHLQSQLGSRMVSERVSLPGWAEAEERSDREGSHSESTMKLNLHLPGTRFGELLSRTFLQLASGRAAVPGLSATRLLADFGSQQSSSCPTAVSGQARHTLGSSSM